MISQKLIKEVQAWSGRAPDNAVCGGIRLIIMILLEMAVNK